MRFLKFFVISFFLVLISIHVLFPPTSVFAQTQPVHTPRVLYIGYDPTDSKGKSLANTYFSSQLEGKTASDFDQLFVQRQVDTFRSLSKGRIQFQVAGTMRITDFPTYPDGSTYTVDSYKSCVFGRSEFDPPACESRKWKFPYVSWVTNNHICEEVNRLAIDEIWMLSDPYIMAYEAFMIGPNPGFYVNGISYTTPVCGKHVKVVNGTYERPESFLHSYGHTIEATMDYLMINWKNEDRDRYWERFIQRQLYKHEPVAPPYCGNVHFPSNTNTEYEYSNTLQTPNLCSDFANFPNYTNQLRLASCSAWGCSDEGWQKYWFAFIPHASGEFAMISPAGRSFAFKKDWWFYYLYPENAISLVKNYVNPSISPPTTFTPSPSPTPTTSPVISTPGDANDDRKVDGIDFTIWLSHYGSTSVNGAQDGDFNKNGTVDGVDFVLWLSNYGK